ncbi:nucleotide exchange factor GrpE [Patescibacteria group bacterium]|nr:nucleotide exchange factor GrpE [Patescibacteria group bacterium]MBU4115882.1 nucleotide exchange factor GrpE [Patescibacteria group bacterium]
MTDKFNKSQENIDPEEIENVEESIDNKIKKIKENLKKCEGEKKEYLNGWQRSKAELINFKKEIESSKKGLILFANENLISEMIPVLDSFDMAFKNKEHLEKVDETWKKGMEYIYSQLITILKNSGLEIIEPYKQKFNPIFHHLGGTIDTNKNEEDNIVLEVLRKGYNLNGKNIRPANVKIGIFKGTLTH